MKTNIKNIYAYGDITGKRQFTHMAAYQAGSVVRDIVSPRGASVDYSSVAWTTSTRPEVAHTGLTEEMASAAGKPGSCELIPLSEADSSLTEGDEEGFLKLVMDKKERIVGATAVGQKAGEIIPAA
ncbi:MAG: hypothetical protein ACLFQK_02770 [Fibrobacterota bacterium]